MPAEISGTILLKKENAHSEDPIYCCDWAKCQVAGDTPNTSKEIIATGGLDGLVKLWSLQQNDLVLLHTLEGHTMGVVCIAFSRTALSLVSVSLDSHLILWDPNSGKKLAEVPVGEGDIWKVSFSPDGQEIVTGGHTGKLYVYGVNDGSIYKILDTREKTILSVDWSLNGINIAAGSEEGNVCIIDIIQSKVLHTVKAHTQAVRCVAFSNCTKRLATASNDGYVKIFAVAGATFQKQLQHKLWVVSVCFSPDGSRIATGCGDGSVRVAKSDNLLVLSTFKEHSDTVWGLNFNSSSKKLISVSKDGQIILYDSPLVKK